MSLHGMDAPFDLGATESEPRASRVSIPNQTRAELWVGGWLSAVGPDLKATHLNKSWIVDCSGELPTELRAAAAFVIPSVFDDVEIVPPQLERLNVLARELGETLSRGVPPARYGIDTPDRVYVLCKQGLNRSAFLAGLILRALPLPSDGVVAELRRSRPGSLSNRVFEDLLRTTIDRASE